MENLTVNFQLPAAAVFVPLMLDDGHGDYNRSYERIRKQRHRLCRLFDRPPR